MRIINSDLEKIAFLKEQYPDESLPEIAFCGRSNVGKSSFINSILDRKNLARISSKPGKTRTVNFYNANNIYYIFVCCCICWRISKHNSYSQRNT